MHRRNAIVVVAVVAVTVVAICIRLFAIITGTKLPVPSSSYDYFDVLVTRTDDKGVSRVSDCGVAKSFILTR